MQFRPWQLIKDEHIFICLKCSKAQLVQSREVQCIKNACLYTEYKRFHGISGLLWAAAALLGVDPPSIRRKVWLKLFRSNWSWRQTTKNPEICTEVHFILSGKTFFFLGGRLWNNNQVSCKNFQTHACENIWMYIWGEKTAQMNPKQKYRDISLIVE